MEKVILFVLNLFLHSPLPLCVNSFCSANTMKFPVDNRGPRVAKNSVGCSPSMEPRNFFLALTR